MTDDHSKDKANHATTSPHSGDDFADLQADFNSLISGSTASPTASVSVSDQPSESEAYKEPTEAFNDLAGAFSAEPTASDNSPEDNHPTSAPITNDDDFTAHLDQSFNEFKSASSAKTFDSDVARHEHDFPHSPQTESPLSHLSTSEYQPQTEASLPHLSTPEHQAQTEASLPHLSTPEHQPEAFTANPKTNNKPMSDTNEKTIYADISGKSSGGRSHTFITAVASVILLVTAGGIYWYTMGSTQQPVQIVQGEQLEIPELFGEPALFENPQKSEVTKQTDRLEKIEPEQQTSPLKKVASDMHHQVSVPDTLSTADAISLITQNNSGTKNNFVTENKASGTMPSQAMTKQAVIKPTVKSSLYDPSKLLTSAQFVTSWVILAPAVSKISADHYASNFRAKYMDSEVLSIKTANKTKYFVRIAGFSSKQSAQKRNKQFSTTLGLRNGVVFKETTRLGSNRMATRQAPVFEVDTMISKPAIKAITPSTPVSKMPKASKPIPTVNTAAKKEPVRVIIVDQNIAPASQDKPKEIDTEEAISSSDISVSFEL